MKQPLVTAMVSTYSAERFMRGCMEDLVAQTLFDEMEVLVIDSGSPQNESAICAEFARQYPQIRVIRTEREPLYAAWNRAIPLAKGKYITSANTDDRHRFDFMESLVTTLETNPQIALVYSNQYVSRIENETYEECKNRSAQVRQWPDYSAQNLMLHCLTGSQPMWRKSLHDELGFFDTRYRVAADYDMWLRIAEKYDFLHIPQTLGLFFDSPHTISGADNWAQTSLETLNVQVTHMNKEHWKSIPDLRKKFAAEIFGTGYQFIEHDKNNNAAKPFFREAIRLDPLNVNYLKTYLIRCIAGIS